MSDSDLVTGYMDGLSDERSELPASLANRSEEYRHGWQNGRDDRTIQPRAKASKIRADMDRITAREVEGRVIK